MLIPTTPPPPSPSPPSFHSLPISYVKQRLGNAFQYPINSRSSNNHNLNKLNIGLFRRGVGSNTNAIITKEVNSYPITFVDNSFRGTIPFYAPRSPGTFVFRLFYDDLDSIVYQLGTSQTMSCVVAGRDLEANLRFILSQFKAKKTSMAALHQLSDVLAGLRNNNPTNNNNNNNNNSNSNNSYNNNQIIDGAGRAAWGCVCEAKKVLDNIEGGGNNSNNSNSNSNGNSNKEDESDIPKILKDDGTEDEELMNLLRKEKKAAEAVFERKKRDIQVAVASVLESAIKNPAARQLFRSEQLGIIKSNYQLWCVLTEGFADEPANNNYNSKTPPDNSKFLYEFQVSERSKRTFDEDEDTSHPLLN